MQGASFLTIEEQTLTAGDCTAYSCDPYGEPLLIHGLQLHAPMENPHCGCKLLTLCTPAKAVIHGLQLRSLWRIPTAAVS